VAATDWPWDKSITAAVALYGAVLSTIVLFKQLRQQRRILHVELSYVIRTGGFGSTPILMLKAA